jgi:hypothetical protein
MRQRRRPTPTFSPSARAFISGGCAAAGTATADAHSRRHALSGLAIRADRPPASPEEAAVVTQSPGEYHRTKSSKQQPGLAALKADMSDSRRRD